MQGFDVRCFFCYIAWIFEALRGLEFDKGGFLKILVVERSYLVGTGR